MYKRIVVKLGTSVLTGGTRRLDRAHMVEIARQCAALRRQGCEVIVVTSGAIAAGRERLDHPTLPPTVAAKQMLAAVGQSWLMHVWESLFDLYNLHVGQMLLTRADVADRDRFLNARDMLAALLEHGIMPIINENDAVATAEIKVGDNDNLSALIALLAEADLLLLLTDQPGLFTADPRTDPDAQLIPEVRHDRRDAPPDRGRECQRAGGGRDDHQAAGRGRGPPRGRGCRHRRGPCDRRDRTRRQRRGGWDALPGPGSAAGEPQALDLRRDRAGRPHHGGLGRGARLARAGRQPAPGRHRRVEGNFERGDTVLIVGPKGKELARGIARYSSADLAQIKGLRSDAIAELLGYTAGPAAVHRNDMILV